MMSLQSIPLRVHVWYGALLLAAITALGMIAYRDENAAMTHALDDELHQRASVLSAAFDRAGNAELGKRLVLTPDESKLFDASDEAGYFYVAWLSNRQELTRSTNSPADIPMPSRDESAVANGLRQRGGFHEAYLFTPAGECVLAGRSMAFISARMRRESTRPVWLGIIFFGLALGGGMFLSMRRP